MQKVTNKNTIAALAIISAVCIATNMFKVSATMSLLLQDFQITKAEAGWLITTVNIMGVVLALPAGGITAKIGTKKIGTLALSFGLLGSALGYVSQSFAMLLFSRFIEGLGFALIAVAVPSIISEWFDEKERGLPMAFWVCAMSIGLFCALKLSNLVTNEADCGSWRNLWLMVTIILAVMDVLFTTLVPQKAYQNEQSDTKEHAGVKFGKDAFLNKAAWCLAIVSITFNCAAIALNNFSATYCQDILQVSLVEANNYTVFLSVGTIIGSIAVGVIFKYVHKYSAALVLGIGINLLGFTMCFNYGASWAAIYLFIMGLIHGLPSAAIYTLAPFTADSPQNTGVVMGILAMAQNLAGFSAVLTGSLLNESYMSATIFVTVLVGIGFVMTLVFKKFFAVKDL